MTEKRPKVEEEGDKAKEREEAKTSRRLCL